MFKHKAANHQHFEKCITVLWCKNIAGSFWSFFILIFHRRVESHEDSRTRARIKYVFPTMGGGWAKKGLMGKLFALRLKIPHYMEC